LRRLLDLLIQNHYVGIDLFPSYRVDIAIHLEMFENLFFLVSEAALQLHGLDHQLVSYPAQKVVWHLKLLPMKCGLVRLELLLDFEEQTNACPLLVAGDWGESACVAFWGGGCLASFMASC